jgi:exonuclease III
MEPGWDVAWSLYRPQPGAPVGGVENGRARAAGTWNGVATFVRAGLLAEADADPLGAERFDREGRCLLTDHGAFVLFNVYVPTSGSSAAYANLPFKMQFLRALRAAMRAKRAAGRAVVLAGDLNLARRPQDVPWRDRLVRLARLFGEQGAEPYAALAPGLADKLRSWRGAVREALAALEIVTVPAKGGGAGGGGDAGARARESFRVVLPRPDARPTQLGKPADSREAVALRWGIGGGLSFPDPDDPAAPPLVGRAADALSVGALAELVTKALALPFTEAEQRALAAVADSPTPPCLLDWAASLAEKDGMVDSYAAFHADAAERFTCWEQYTNARYENCGARIDYVYVDGPLFAARALAGAPLATGGAACAPEAAEAARAAATAGGGWQPAPFDGSGIPEPPRRVLDTQFEPPGTGIRYMPPPYSDHTAITLLLGDAEPPPPPLALAQGGATLRAMPHRQTRSLKSFFAPRAADAGGSGAGVAALAAPPAAAAAAAPATGADAAGGSSKKRPAPPPPPPLPPGQKSVRDMFGGGARPKPK